jgi:purine-nucleoside phosphorylase
MEKLIKKLVTIQSELKAPKSQRNNFGNYNYRSCEDILEAVKPHLLKNGLFLSITDELVNIGDRYYIKATSIITDGIDKLSVDAYAREEENKKGMDSSQISGACGSYARKYSLNGLFLIDDAKDSDATNTHDDKPKTISASEAVQLSNLLNAAIAETNICENVDKLKAIWASYPMFHTNTTFKDLINNKKLEFKQ